MLNAAQKKILADLGVDVASLEAAVTNPAETAFTFAPKSGEIKIGDATYHLYDDAGHNGLKGRVKAETLTQATELGVKAVAEKAGVDYKGNDPEKLIAAITAKLNIPVDEKVKEKDRDIATMRTNWETEKAQREQLAARLKDREDTDRDISFFPENRIKSVKDRTLRMELKDEGVTFGEHEGKPAVFLNGEVQKNQDLTLKDPKTFAADFFKTKGWIAAEAAPAGAPAKKTFDVKTGDHSKPAFDEKGTYERIMAENNGQWNLKAQAQYTESMIAANAPAPVAV